MKEYELQRFNPPSLEEINKPISNRKLNHLHLPPLDELLDTTIDFPIKKDDTIIELKTSEGSEKTQRFYNAHCPIKQEVDESSLIQVESGTSKPNVACKHIYQRKCYFTNKDDDFQWVRSCDITHRDCPYGQ